MGWEVAVGLAGTFLALVFGLLARWERRKGNKSEALLGEAYEAIKELDAQVARSLEALPTNPEFHDRLIRLRDRKNRVWDSVPKRSGD